MIKKAYIAGQSVIHLHESWQYSYHVNIGWLCELHWIPSIPYLHHSFSALSPTWPPPFLHIPSSTLSSLLHALINGTFSSWSSHPALLVFALLHSLAPSSLHLIHSRSSTSQIDFAAVLWSLINSQIGFPTYPLPLGVCISFFHSVTLTFLPYSIVFALRFCLTTVLFHPDPSFFVWSLKETDSHVGLEITRAPCVCNVDIFLTF